MENKGLRLMILVFLTAGWLLLMRWMTAPLNPQLIIDFEFIGTARNAKNFLSSLAITGELALLIRSIFLDCIFPLLYGMTFYYATAWVCSKLPEAHMFNRFKVISGLTIAAVICDFFENMSLINLIYYSPEDLYAYSAYFFAAVKFTLLGLVLAHFIISGLILIIDWKKLPTE